MAPQTPVKSDFRQIAPEAVGHLVESQSFQRCRFREGRHLYCEAMIRTFGPPWVQRTILASISLLIIMLGIATLLHGKIEYSNWWGGIVFAPFAIIIGSLGLLIAAFKPTVFLQTEKKKRRFRGWPRGRVR